MCVFLLQVLSCLRQLQPRLYSISSSPLEDPTRVQVTVAEVMYSSLGKDRVGVCSTMLSQRIQVRQVVCEVNTTTWCRPALNVR